MSGPGQVARVGQGHWSLVADFALGSEELGKDLQPPLPCQPCLNMYMVG